ncbi:hypothetical protein BLOT_003873 [Blomia tropicalis]|nr:hypothetical protein BLOT_003873 [Blomia tropicalis]
MNNDATSSISVFALYTADRRKLVDDHDDDLSSRSLQQSFSQWMAISFVSYPIGINCKYTVYTSIDDSMFQNETNNR